MKQPFSECHPRFMFGMNGASKSRFGAERCWEDAGEREVAGGVGREPGFWH